MIKLPMKVWSELYGSITITAIDDETFTYTDRDGLVRTRPRADLKPKAKVEVETTPCRSCGGPNDKQAAECRFCGAAAVAVA